MNIEQEYKDFKHAIEDAGKFAREYFDSPLNPNTQKKDGSVVTEIDEKIEKIIRTHIQERFPDDSIVGEEGDTVAGTSEFVWFIDPIDGTDNFVRKIPFFAVTASRLGPGPEDSFAVVHNPISGQTFASLMEDGAYENEHLCDLDTPAILGTKFIAAGGPSRLSPWVKTARANLWKSLGEKFGKSGGYHSALMTFAYVAAGRLDGYLSLCHSPWDTSTGLYLVRAAGGEISIYEDGGWHKCEGPIKELYGPDYTNRPIIFVSPTGIHQDVLDFVGDPHTWTDK